MKRNCPKCNAHKENICRFGRYYRVSDSKWVSRFKCNVCKKHFSSATFSSCFNQNKRRLNPVIYKMLASCMSQRRIALVLGISRTTVSRKLTFLAIESMDRQFEWLKRSGDQIRCVQFDDLETIEHTKCKPLSVTVAVDAETRKILHFTVSKIPAKGHLAKISRKKYGKRPDESRKRRSLMFEQLALHLPPTVEFHTDQHVDYPVVLKRYFPKCQHFTYKRSEGCVTGQGELKKTKFDPIFMINHTLAMLRANVNRLVRKTWCTTKKIDFLEQHLAIYTSFHNEVLTAKS